MADLKISQLNSIVTVVPATDVLPVVQGGTTLKITPKQILESGSPAVLASATITGDLTVDTSTLVVDATNDRVGIGTTTPAYKLEVATGTSGQQALASFRTADTTAANNAGIQIYATPSSTAASRSVLLSLDADGADASGGDYFFIQKLGNSGQVDLNQQSNAAMTFSTNGTERARITASGDVNITTGNVVMSTSGKGIDFSATASGSGTMTSELLNDYEEGTFVPTLSGSTTNPTTTQSGTGRYTKVGRQVTVQIFFNNVTTVGASGQILVNGLPFANNGTVEAIADTAFYNMATFTGVPFGLVPVNVSQIQIYSSQSNGVFLPVTYNAGAVQYLWANLTYTV